MSIPTPSKEYLQTCFSYAPDTGYLFWKERTDASNAWNARFPGKIACSKRERRSGEVYYQTGLNGRQYLTHRLIWKLVTGMEPNIIDHINGDSIDNRFVNLRNVTQKENLQNKTYSAGRALLNKKHII